jgi:hypothetical protein
MVVRSARLSFKKLPVEDRHMKWRYAMMARAMFLSMEAGHDFP